LMISPARLSVTPRVLLQLHPEQSQSKMSAEEELPPSKLGTKEHWDEVYE